MSISPNQERPAGQDKIDIPSFIRTLVPGSKDVRVSLRLFLYILVGGIALYPLMVRLPVLGWDWYYHFNAHSPVDNIYVNTPLFPYSRYIIMLLTWMSWRDSLAILGGLTYMAIAIGTWANRGRYGSIALAILNPLPLFVLWIGHPEGLALMGMITGIIPLALIKPQITFWSFLRNKALFFWTAVTIGLVILIWPAWLGVFSPHWGNYSDSFGWQALGWPMIIVGAILIAGAGSDPWKLMAAGCFLTPDLMPYHMVVLLPAIGRVQKGWKGVVWLCTWFIFLGTGLGGNYRFINLLLPISIYLALQTPQGYKETILNHLARMRHTWIWISKQIKTRCS